jgi:hypothetical protein
VNLKRPFNILLLVLTALAVLWQVSFLIILVAYYRSGSIWTSVDASEFWRWVYLLVPVINFVFLIVGSIRRENSEPFNLSTLVCFVFASTPPIFFFLLGLFRFILSCLAGIL